MSTLYYIRYFSAMVLCIFLQIEEKFFLTACNLNLIKQLLIRSFTDTNNGRVRAGCNLNLIKQLLIRSFTDTNNGRVRAGLLPLPGGR